MLVMSHDEHVTSCLLTVRVATWVDLPLAPNGRFTGGEMTVVSYGSPVSKFCPSAAREDAKLLADARATQ